MSVLNSYPPAVGCDIGKNPRSNHCATSLSEHYILKCPLYSALQIRYIIVSIAKHSILLYLDSLDLVNIVLKGCNDQAVDEKANICNTVQHFIIESVRFT